MNTILFIIPMLIWGSTWYVIKFQLGSVDPMISVIYRFFLSGGLLLIFAILKGYQVRYSLREHFFMFLQGTTLFGVNYWFVYMAEETLTSGLVAILFSLMIFANIFLGALVLNTPVQKITIGAAVMGVAGTVFIFSQEYHSFQWSNTNLLAVAIVLISVLMASTGNILSGLNQKNRIKVIPGNAFSMIYGAAGLLIIAVLLGKPFTFDVGAEYTFSLLYLSLFGSIAAFGAYLTLLGRIGPHKAGYITLLVPVLAMFVSTIFESYEWNPYSILGITLLILGNYLVLQAKSQKVAA